VQGDRSALEQLIRRHQGFVYSLTQRMLYSPEDTADATQEILICIVTNLASWSRMNSPNTPPTDPFADDLAEGKSSAISTFAVARYPAESSASARFPTSPF
jgi:hypothetical protein